MRESKKRKRLAGAGEADWSDGISVDLFTLISSNFDSIESYIAFAAVCRSWYNIIASYRISEPTPWLMLSENQDSASRSFFSFRGNNVFDIEFPPEIKGRRCWGSPFGWIITYDSNNDDMNLYNPLSKASILLPKLFPFFTKKYPVGLGYKRSLLVSRPDFLIKAILTASPGSPDCLVLIVPATYDVVYAKPRDTVWSVVRGANLGDILSFGGNLYGCEWKTGKIVTLNYETDFCNQLVLKGFADGPPEMINRSQEVVNEYHRKKYLVDLGGELYLVFRYVLPASMGLPGIEDYSLTYDFEVYKIDLSAKVWKIVKSLGDHCLFVGTNNAFAVSVSYDHEVTRNSISLSPNCIYFLDDKAFYNKSEGSDIGVFHVGERKFGARPLGENAGPMFDGYNYHHRTHRPQPFMLKTLASGLYSHSCPPFWITPCVQFQKACYRDHHQQKIEAKVKKLPNMKDGSYVKITPDVEDEERRKLMIQLRNQFTYTEKNGVNRRPWVEPF